MGRKVLVGLVILFVLVALPAWGQGKIKIEAGQYKVVEHLLGVVKVSWKADIRNFENRPVAVWVKVIFFDADGFKLDQDTTKAILRPNGITTVSDTLLMEDSVYEQVSRAEVTVEEY